METEIEFQEGAQLTDCSEMSRYVLTDAVASIKHDRDTLYDSSSGKIIPQESTEAVEVNGDQHTEVNSGELNCEGGKLEEEEGNACMYDDSRQFSSGGDIEEGEQRQWRNNVDDCIVESSFNKELHEIQDLEHEKVFEPVEHQDLESNKAFESVENQELEPEKALGRVETQVLESKEVFESVEHQDLEPKDAFEPVETQDLVSKEAFEPVKTQELEPETVFEPVETQDFANAHGETLPDSLTVPSVIDTTPYPTGDLNNSNYHDEQSPGRKDERETTEDSKSGEFLQNTYEEQRHSQEPEVVDQSSDLLVPDATPVEQHCWTQSFEAYPGVDTQQSSVDYMNQSNDMEHLNSNGSELEQRFGLSPSAHLGTDFAFTRSLSSESNVSEGRLSQEPVNRTPVEKVAAPEITKNVRRMFETGDIPDRHEIKKTVATFEEPTDSGVFENEPVQNEGVVRSGEYVNDVEDVQKGATRSLLNQWNEKGKDEFKADRKPILLAEDEGRVLESQPIRRDDVVREEDTDYTKDLPTKGHAKSLTQEWLTRKDDFYKEQKPIKLFENENEPAVVENQPEVRTDVLREGDNSEEVWLRKGFTRNLAGYWSGPKEEARAPRDAPIDLGLETDGVIAENEPTVLEGVVRSDEPIVEVVPIEKGRAKNMVSKWQTLPDQPSKEPFRLDINPNETGVYENDPVQLEGVVKCHAQVDDVLGQKGMIKNISERFLQQDEEPRKPRDMIVIDRAEGPEVLENNPEPVRADVVRSEYDPSAEVQVERGTTKNLVHRWKTQDLEQTSPNTNKDRLREDPAWILQAERAAESGVFENQPEVRTDVIREVDYEPEMISAKQTRNMREKWNKMGLEDGKSSKCPELVRFTPPRELTPPRFYQEDFKSYQALTLSSDSTSTSCGPSPTKSPAPQQHLSHNANNMAAAQRQSSAGDQTVTSSAVLVLKSS